MDQELYYALSERGVACYGPQTPPHNVAHVEILREGTVVEAFDVDSLENDVHAIVDALLEHVSTRSYAVGEHVEVRSGAYQRSTMNAGPTPHTGHFSHLGGTWFCDTCKSPYCELA